MRMEQENLTLNHYPESTYGYDGPPHLLKILFYPC